MRKVINIKLKDEPNAKLRAVKAIKDTFSLGLKESLDLVNDLIEKREIDLNVDTRLTSGWYYMEPKYTGEKLEVIFDCKYIDDETCDPYKYEPPKPDPETALALNWYDGLSDEEKRKIDLIGKWKNPILVACG